MSESRVFGLFGWLIGGLAFAVIGGRLWDSPWLFAVFAVLVVVFIVNRWNARRRAKKLGYSVHYHSPGLVRGGDKDVEIVYLEGDNKIYFKGVLGDKHERDTLFVPDAVVWDAEMESWAKGRRAEIVGRVFKDSVTRNFSIADSADRK